MAIDDTGGPLMAIVLWGTMLPNALHHHYTWCLCRHANTLISTHTHTVDSDKMSKINHTSACLYGHKTFGLSICCLMIRDKTFWMVSWKPIVPCSPWWYYLLSYNKLCLNGVCVCVCNNRIKKLNESCKWLNITVWCGSKGTWDGIDWTFGRRKKLK